MPINWSALDSRSGFRQEYTATNYGASVSQSQHLLVTDVISEGPIGGLVEGGTSVFVNSDPIIARGTSPYIAPAGQTITLTSGSTSATVNLNNTTFQELYTADYGKRYLSMWGAYPGIKATSSAAPVASNKTAQSEGTVTDGWEIALTRTSGTALATSFNAPSNRVAYGEVSSFNIVDGTVRASLKTGTNKKSIAGILTGITGGSNNFTFKSKDKRLLTELFADADHNGSTEHTLFLHLYLEIAGISGTTVTLANASPITLTKRFGITGPQRPTTGTSASSELAKIKKYPGTDFQFNPGTIDQEPLIGIDGVAGTNSVVLNNISSTALEKDTPIIITGTGAQASLIDEVKIVIAYPSGLYSIDEGNGKKFSAAAAYKIELSVDRGGNSLDTFEVVPGNGTFGGVPVFTNETWQESAVTFETRVNLEDFQPFANFKIKITRLTKHSFTEGGGTVQIGSLQLSGDEDHKIIGAAQIQAVTGIIKEKLNFAYTAYANLKFWSKTFGSMPKRTYECYGLKVKVPSNYVTREEANGISANYKRNVSTGAIESTPQFWDGNFRDELVYTDNPAWVFHDILTNNRYGLGDYLEAGDIDKYSLYKIARHCDELVPDGKGGQEPRFRANIYLTKATDAYKIMKDFATVFRGILYWADSKFFAVIDEKKQPIFNFSRSNVIDGQFSYETTGDKTRINQVVVEWNNPDNEFKLEPLIIEDRENQIKTSKIRTEKAIAFGCTSEGQAIRYGRWKLWTSINQTEVVSFTTSLNASFLTPGDIINIHDDVDYEIPFSGRMSDYSSGTPSITLDRTINSHFSGSHSYIIAVLLPKRTILLNQASATIATSGGDASKSRGDEITEATVQGAVRTLIHSTTGTVNGAVNNSKNVTMDASNSLIAVGDTITGAGIDRTITVEAVSGTSLTLSDPQTLADNITLTFENPETTQQNIASAVDTSGDPLNLQYEESTIVEERTLTTGSTTTSDGKDTIPLSSAFSVTPLSGAVWAVKEIPSGETEGTTASYKQYKILSIAEDNNAQFGIVAVEYYESKFDAVDSKEFTVAADDPLYPPERTEEVPAPKNLRILREPLASEPGEEFTLMWDPPDPLSNTGVSEVYENLAEFEITHDVEGLESPIIRGAETRSEHFKNVPNGFHTFGVRTKSGLGRMSARSIIEVQVNDIFDDDFPRVWGGIVRGGFSSVDVDVSNSGADKGTLRFDSDDFVAAPLHDPQLAKRNTSADANSFSLDLTPLANANYPQQSGPGNAFDWGYAFMDFSKLDASNPNADALKLIAYKRDTTLDLTYWYDVTKFLANANNIWTSVGNVNVTQGSVKVTASSSIFTGLEVPESLKIGTGFGAKVAYVESGTVLYMDRPWTAASATGQALSKQELEINYKDDFIISPVTFHAAGTDDDSSSGRYGLGGGNGGNSFLVLKPELEKQGRAIVVDSDVQFLEYNAAEAQQSAADINLTLQAVGFQEAEFQVTGTGFNSVSTAASSFEFADLTVTDNKVSIKIHETDDQASIAYNSAAPLSFTITAREKQFPNATNRQATAVYNIGKIREGSQGNSTALVYLYKNSTSALTSSDIDSNFPTVTVTLSGTGAGTITAISSGSISGAGQIASTGWHKTPQTIGTGEKAYVVAATANGTGSTDTIAFGEWSDPVQFTGSDGLNSATVELFQLTNSTNAPSDPNQTLTYTFADGTLKNSSNATSGTGFNSWVSQASTPVANNKYLWKITAAAISSAATDTIVGSNGSSEWSDAILAAQFGAEGAAGLRSIQGYLFYESTGTSAPAKPTGNTYSFSTGLVTGTGINDAGTTNVWRNTPRPQDPAAGTTQWTIRYYGTEASASSSTIGVVYSTNNGVSYTNFTGVVTFNGGTFSQGGNAVFNTTTIDGSNITTGRISSVGNTSQYGTDANGNFATDGTHFDLTNGRIRSPDFYIDGSGAKFKGTIQASNFTGTNTLSGSGNTVTIGAASQIVLDGNNQQIKITDGSNTRVKLGNLAV
tara:strand:+ start:483 stop:6443 length:5961 start_codon:yes stop_codon:yes gene_type:complete